MKARLKRVGIAALALFTLYALRQVDAGAPEGPVLVIIAAAIMWVLLAAPTLRHPRRTR